MPKPAEVTISLEHFEALLAVRNAACGLMAAVDPEKNTGAAECAAAEKILDDALTDLFLVEQGDEPEE